MRVVSQPLCEELFRLSKWGKNRHNEGIKGFWTDRLGGYSCPKYDLGYLIRKLPPTRVKLVNKINAETGNRFWLAQYHHSNVPKRMFESRTAVTVKKRAEVVFTADTPEDAACLLAIELVKLGELEAAA